MSIAKIPVFYATEPRILQDSPKIGQSWQRFWVSPRPQGPTIAARCGPFPKARTAPLPVVR